MRKRTPVKTVKAIGAILAAVIAAALLGMAVLIWVYPAILRGVHNIEAPGIDLMETLEIGGLQQTLYFRGENIESPALLLIHGGPGYPEMAFLHDFQYAWEKDFTVVQWDQRNAGKTYFLNDPKDVLETMSFERALADAYEVTQHIKQKLNKDKVVILGYSWGSVLGSALAQAYPQDVSAYIGLGQAVNMRENERVGYEAVLEAARAAGNGKDIAVLEALAPYPPPEAFNESFLEQVSTIRPYQAKYKLADSGGIGTIMQVLKSPYYTFRDKTYFLSDMLYYQMPLFEYLFDDYDLRHFGTAYEVPVFYIMGERDYQTPYPLAKDYFNEISAPHKEFFTVPDAGHAAMQDNKTEFNRILLEEIRPLLDS